VIFYEGWMDPAVPARMVTAYHERLVKAAGGPAAAARFERLYMLPGVYHCAGGPGADRAGGSGQDGVSLDPEHDMLSALEAWVERGRPPASLVAAKVEDGKVVRTRRLCPYPLQARYDGKGDRDRAESFVCARPPA